MAEAVSRDEFRIRERVLEIGWNIASPYASASEGPRGGGLPGPPGVTPV